MKQILFSTLFQLLLIPLAFSQLYINGATIKINTGSSLYTDMELSNTNNASLQNEGTLHLDHNLNNESDATLSGNGQYIISGNWTNAATYTADTATVVFDGDANSTVISGADAFYQIHLEKAEASGLQLGDDLVVNKDLQFVLTNNKVVLGNFNLTIGSTATITGYDADDYIVTSGTGQVLKTDLGAVAFLFPIGYNNSTYNPLIITNDGTLDEIGVCCLENALEDGTSGLPFIEGVTDVSWELSEATVGGSDLNLTASWSTADELPGFDRTDCGLSGHDGSDWDLLLDDLGAASGSDPYTVTRNNVTDLSVFTVGAKEVSNKLAMNIKVFLSGPYSGGGMNDDLRSLTSFPLTEPYTNLGFAQEGFGGGETIAAAVLSDGGTNDNIVDWILVELRDGNDKTIVKSTKVALLQKDGDIVDLDGTSDLEIVGFPDDTYFIAIKHRNHLGFCTNETRTLNGSSSAHDLTDGSISIFGTNALKDLGGSVSGMWSGNTFTDDKVKYQGADNDSDVVKNDILGQAGNFFNLLTFTYSDYNVIDANLDGVIKYQGANNDSDLVKNNILGHPGNFFSLLTFTISQQMP